MLQSAEARDPKLSLLTPQERECLRLVAQQRSSKEIASQLGISKASVDTYCNRARAKLGVASRRDAAQLVLNHETLAAASPPASVETPPGERPQSEAPPGGALPPTVALLPPISSLGAGARLGIIMGGAVVLALAFGMLVSGLQSLNDVVQSARARGVASSTPPPQRAEIER
jgi:DNA-binding CsgD family transcriptional regulator